MIESIFLNEFMLINQVHQKSVILVTSGILKLLNLTMNDLYLSNGWYDLMQKAMSFNNAAIVYVKRSAYIIHFWYMGKDDTINIINNSNLVDKMSVLYIFLLLYVKNEWMQSRWINLLSNKQRCDTK